MSKRKVKNGYLCTEPDCDREFKTMRGVEQHMRIAHPYVPPPPPITTTLGYIGEILGQRLTDRLKTVNVGDRLVFTQEVVVKRLSRTEGYQNVVVDVDKITDSWTHKNS